MDPKIDQFELASVIANNYSNVITRPFRTIQQSGWEDMTFLVVQEPTSKVSNGQPAKFIFKLFCDTSNSSNAQQVQKVEAEIELINKLNSAGFPVPKIIQTSLDKFHGEAVLLVGGQKRQNCRFRLQTFLSGDLLVGGISTQVSRQLGALIGRLDQRMATFSLPYFDARPDLDFLVCSSIDSLRTCDLLESTDDPTQKAIAVKFLQSYKANILEKNEHFGVQLIHCDIHGGNLVVEEEAGRIVGVFDFGDARVTLRILEPATALFSVLVFASDRQAATTAFLEAYSKHIELSPEEASALPIAIAGVIVHALVIYNHLKTADPSFRTYDYLERLYANAWNLAADLLNDNSPTLLIFSRFFRN